MLQSLHPPPQAHARTVGCRGPASPGAAVGYCFSRRRQKASAGRKEAPSLQAGGGGSGRSAPRSGLVPDHLRPCPGTPLVIRLSSLPVCSPGDCEGLWRIYPRDANHPCAVKEPRSVCALAQVHEGERTGRAEKGLQRRKRRLGG